MKIVFASPVSLRHYGGAEKWISTTANLLEQKGHNVSISALPYLHRKERISKEKLEGILNNVKYFESWKPKIEADITYVYYQPLIWRLFKIKGKTICGLHTPGIFYGKTIRRTVFNLCGTLDLKSFDAVHVINRAFEDIIDHENVFYVPNWIDTSKYKPANKRYDTFTVAFVGRRMEEKGWNDYVEICRKLDKKTDAKIDFVATGGEDIPPIRGFGFLLVDELVEIMSKSHVLVYPSQADVFSLTILESMSCGTPVITTPISSHKGMDLPLIYGKNCDEMTERVLDLYKQWNNESYKQISDNCRYSALKYREKKVFEEFEKRILEWCNL